MEPNNENKRNSRLPSRQMCIRAIAACVILCLVFVLLVGRLSFLQIVQHEKWSTLAISQQLTDEVVHARRGEILDANGEVLAKTMDVWTVIMVPSNIKELKNADEVRTKIADEVSKILGIDRDKLYKRTQNVDSQYEKIATQIDNPTLTKLSEWQEKNELDTSGIFRTIPDYKRIYPYGSLASCVIGFTGDDYYGLYGLEAAYEDVLAGTDGRVVTAQNAYGSDMPVEMAYEKTVEPEDGHTLVLTIDHNIQSFAEKYLEQSIKENNVQNRGVSIVMDVDTGAVLAMAVKGDFDLNDPFTVKDPNALAAIKLLSGDEKSDAVRDALQKQWSNKAVSDFYEPGSVFKVFTSCMALEEGVANLNTQFFCPGYIEVMGQQITCWHPGHGMQNFPDIISNSCNPGFITLGVGLGGERYFKYFTGFGFTEPTGIDMLSEGRSTPSLYHGADMTDLDVATSAMGQTFEITPIQMATALCAVANGGYLMQPYVVAQELDAHGNVVKATEPIVKRQVVSTETTKQVASMLAAAVNGGGSKNVYVAGYRVAGKSGTSDKTETRTDWTKNEVWGSFGTFAPADDPEIVVLTIIDTPHSDVSNYGSHVSGPVCQSILADTLPYLGVEPLYTEEELAGLSSTTPSVVDKEVSAATAIIGNNDLKYHILGDGKTVLKQIPEGGTSIPKDGTVVLYTDSASQDVTTTVPDFHNMTLSQANDAARAANLNLEISGVGLDSGEATVYSQDYEPGAKVSPGTVLYLVFITDNAIA